MSNRIKVEKGSGNIFKDLGFSDEIAEEELLKAQLGAEIFRILKERKLTQVTCFHPPAVSKSVIAVYQETGKGARYFLSKAILRKIRDLSPQTHALSAF